MWCEHVQTSVCDSEWYECGSEHLQMSLCVQVCVSTQEHMRGCECECVTHLCGACVMGTYECSACVATSQEGTRRAGVYEIVADAEGIVSVTERVSEGLGIRKSLGS